MVDIAKFRENFWRDVKKDFYVKNPTMGPNRKRFISKLVKENNIKSVLELGCCSGGNLKSICNVCPDIKIVGFDINQEAIKYAKNVEKIDAEFVIGSLFDLSCFNDKSFDLVFTCAVLVHIPTEKIEYIVKNMIRISKKFVFNIEMQGKNQILTVSNNVPYAWINNYIEIYKNFGLSPKTKEMQKLIGSKDKIGVARDIVWCSICGDNFKI